MKKNLVILILCAVMVGSLAYAYTQKLRADFCDSIALQNEATIMELKGALDRVKKIAEQNLNEAMLQSRRADQVSENCKKSK